MRILATYNGKGGVGKTAAAVNLAYLASLHGSRTLLWDLDPQGATTYYFRIRPRVKGGARKLLKKGADPAGWIRGTDYPGLDLLPADFSYRHLDLLLGGDDPGRRLRRAVAPLAPRYDDLFLDCPPSVSAVSEAVLRVADALLVPVIPTTLSVRTLDQVLELRAACGAGEVAVLPFFSMVDRRKKLHREILADLPRRLPDMLDTWIPYASAVERMGIHREPVHRFAPRSPAAAAFEALWAEVSRRVDGG